LLVKPEVEEEEEEMSLDIDDLIFGE